MKQFTKFKFYLFLMLFCIMRMTHAVVYLGDMSHEIVNKTTNDLNMRWAIYNDFGTQHARSLTLPSHRSVENKFNLTKGTGRIYAEYNYFDLRTLRSNHLIYFSYFDTNYTHKGQEFSNKDALVNHVATSLRGYRNIECIRDAFAGLVTPNVVVSGNENISNPTKEPQVIPILVGTNIYDIKLTCYILQEKPKLGDEVLKLLNPSRIDTIKFMFSAE